MMALARENPLVSGGALILFTFILLAAIFYIKVLTKSMKKAKDDQKTQKTKRKRISKISRMSRNVLSNLSQCLR